MKLNTSPYPVQLEVVHDWSTFSKKHKAYRGTEPKEDATIDGKTCYVADNHVLIGIFDDNRVTLVHELNHFCIYTFGFIGLPINDESSEAYCYYMDSLLKQIPQFKEYK